MHKNQSYSSSTSPATDPDKHVKKYIYGCFREGAQWTLHIWHKFILDLFHIRPYGIVGYAPVHNIYKFSDRKFNGFCKILNLDVSREQLMNEAQLQLIPCCKKTVPFEDLQISVHE